MKYIVIDFWLVSYAEALVSKLTKIGKFLVGNLFNKNSKGKFISDKFRNINAAHEKWCAI